MCKLKDFYDISIKGRYAYAMCCLENAILHYGFDREQWKQLLNIYWSFTKEEDDYFDLWCMCAKQYRPSRIFKSIQKFDVIFDKYIDEIDKNYLQMMADNFEYNSNDIINQLIEHTINIADTDLYKDVFYPGKRTLSYLKYIVTIMRLNKIEVPNVKQFTKYVYDPYNIGDENANNGEFVANLDDEGRKQLLCHAYGLPFDGTQYSKILNK